MTDKVELIVLRNLLFNPEYTRRVLPFIKEEYFHDACEQRIFKNVREFINKYESSPSPEALNIILSEQDGISQGEYDTCVELVKSLVAEKESINDAEWLIDETEKFCKDKAIYNALMESIQIIDGKKNSRQTRNAIPEILSEALGISFDTSVGHDFVEDSDDRFAFYHKIENKVPFDLDKFNSITRGGLSTKTLSVILAGTGIGKSLFMCHMAAACLTQNKNVLYITCEMAEERIAERIDANLMNITIDDLHTLPKEVFDRKIKAATAGITGKLIVKEYPTATANSDHFRHLMDELRLKKNFKPDIVFVDYLNICTSTRFKMGNNVNSFSYIKAIAEELRGLAVQANVPLVTATQTNRAGFKSTNVGLEDTSESFGLPYTADFMFALISTEELEDSNQIMVKQLKNRYSNVNVDRKFVIGVDRPKMKLYDVSDGEQNVFQRVAAQSDEMKREEEEIDSLEEPSKSNPFKKPAAKERKGPFDGWKD